MLIPVKKPSKPHVIAILVCIVFLGGMSLVAIAYSQTRLNDQGDLRVPERGRAAPPQNERAAPPK
jgi:hypothetical protein